MKKTLLNVSEIKVAYSTSNTPKVKIKSGEDAYDVLLASWNLDTIELQEVSKRWSSDMKSDSWLSKNTRPMTLIFLTISLVIFILLDGFDISFGIDTGWIDLLKSLLITVYVAYFGSRGAEKFKSIGK